MDNDDDLPVETPVVVVEDDEIVNTPPTVRPVVAPATPAVPTVAPAVPARPQVGQAFVDTPSVLGDTVTRSVAAGQLPRTGDDSAAGLAPFGLTLLLAGLALQRAGRRTA